VGGFVLVALVGPLVWRVDPNGLVAGTFERPSWAHPMGTDDLGRDVLARIIHGTRVSIQVGATAIGIALVFGTIMGVAGGYFRGVIDSLLGRVVDIMFALPALLLAIVIAGLLGPSRRNALIAIGIALIPAFARIVRGSVLEVTSRPFIESSRALGATNARIIATNVMPNILTPLLVITTLYLGTAVLAEASLSFLGLGTQLPEASWGGMLNSARPYVETAPWLAIFPGAAIMLLVLGLNFLGDGLRDVLDPRLGPREARVAGALSVQRDSVGSGAPVSAGFAK
jgi:peptide/nickel transport system permease protein